MSVLSGGFIFYLDAAWDFSSNWPDRCPTGESGAIDKKILHVVTH